MRKKLKYIIFDGDCGVCSASAEFIERNKKSDNLKTIPSFLFDFDKYGIDSNTAGFTVIYLDSVNNKTYYKIRAIGEICKNLNGIYFVLGYLLSNPIASFIFNPVYNLIAKNRAYISRKLKLNACKIK
jgi:predicted DCC family thiol-disulfide oxidoreductase YuxK